MLLGCIADDFTGASDLAGALSSVGMRTSLVVSRNAAVVDRDACVIALKTRSTTAAEAVESSLKAFEWLRSQGCDHFLFKYCSTFDSTVEGNIGPVAEALARALDVRGVVICPAFPETGRTVYQGHLFVRDQLLSESGMQNHPITPMIDPDVRRWLGLQTKAKIGHIPFATVRRGATAVRFALSSAMNRDETFVVVDALDGDDIQAIGEAVAGSALVTGGSAIGAGIAASFKRSGRFNPQKPIFEAVKGHGAVLAGSCSDATRAQVIAYEQDHPSLALDVAAIVEGRTETEAVARFLFEHRTSAPLCYSSGTPEQVMAIHGQYGRDRVSNALDRFFGDLAKSLLGRGVVRLVVAGGETSGAVVAALNPDALDIGPEIDPGVPALSMKYKGASRALALKSGNFGGPDFFEKALQKLGADA